MGINPYTCIDSPATPGVLLYQKSTKMKQTMACSVGCWIIGVV